MANCPNCNHPQADGAIFCELCGAMVNTASTENLPLEPPMITKLRALGTSKLMLSAAILYSVMLLFSLFNAFISFLMGSFSLPLANLILCIALWAVYATAKKPVGSLVSIGGITALRVLRILEAALLGVCGVILLASLIFVFAMGGFDQLGAEFGEELALFYLLLFAGLIVCSALMVLIDIFAIRFYGSVKETLQTGFGSCVSAVPFGVFLLIGGIFALLIGAGYIIFAPSLAMLMQNIYAGLETLVANMEADIRLMQDVSLPGVASWIISGASGVISGAGQILAAVLVFKYRKTIKE